MEFAIVKPKDMLAQAFADPQGKLVEIKKQWDHAVRAGLKGQLQRIRRWAIATKLKEVGCALLVTESHPSSWMRYRLLKASTHNGDLRQVTFQSRDWHIPPNEWRRTKLHKFKGNIPPEIVRELPTGAGAKAYVFHPSERAARDPYIALKVGRNEYIAVWQWD